MFLKYEVFLYLYLYLIYGDNQTNKYTITVISTKYINLMEIIVIVLKGCMEVRWKFSGNKVESNGSTKKGNVIC